MINILVTGAGALLGQGILRSLRMIRDMEIFIVAADPSPKSTGHFLSDKAYLIPFAIDEDYTSEIEKIIIKEKIDIVFVGTDTELPILSTEKDYLEGKHNVKIIVSSPSVIEIANNKWKTSEFLKKHNFPYPKSALTTDMASIQKLIELNEFPYIAKPVDGARSKGLRIVSDKDQLLALCRFENNLVVQELIGKESDEYTSGCLVLNGKCHSVVTLRRDLRDGNTWRAYRKGDCQYDALIREIAEKLCPEGPVNFQFRIKSGQPVIFEINGRFSGTTPIRAIFGFNEVEALLRYYFEGSKIDPPVLKDGVLMRTFSDIFVENEVMDQLSKNKVIVNPESTYFPFI
jgi:carbamoyl-phosphate synthase large subunit